MRNRGGWNIWDRIRRLGPGLRCILTQQMLGGKLKFRRVRLISFLSVVALAAAGCGDTQHTKYHGEALTQAVRKLEQGASIEAVTSQLGDAISEAKRDSETMLNYGMWQLSFVNDHLTTRSRVAIPEQAQPIQESRRLERKILSLARGISIGRARSMLAVPEEIYEIYEDSPRPTEILRYGSWELSFVNGKLSQRSK
jgi:hypothetical protein